MRWNVVIGGQLFSKSFLGYTTYKMGFATKEGLLPAIVLVLLPFGILWGLVKLLPAGQRRRAGEAPAAVPRGAGGGGARGRLRARERARRLTASERSARPAR